MLSERVKELLHANQLVVAIGARGTGKSHCAADLRDAWCELGMEVLQLDASTAQRPEDLELPLAASLGCDPRELTAASMPDNKVLRVVVDRAEHLYDRPWLAGLQERWRALISEPDLKGRLAVVFFGRPIFRQIAGGDSSPLLNAGPVITTQPLSTRQIASVFGVDESCADAVRRKTGGHPKLTAGFLEAIDGDIRKIGKATQDFVAGNRHYIVKLVQDHPLAARAVLSELLETRGAVSQGALIRQHFGYAHADGVEAIDDLEASGLLVRGNDGVCAAGAELLRKMDGLRGLLGRPTVPVPAYDAEIMGEAARLVFLAENRLRRLVAENLTEDDPTWWLSQVSPEMRGDAEGRREEEGDVLSLDEAHLHPVMYLSLGELFELIYRKESWDRVFRAAFPIGRAGVEESARRFIALRNRVAHSRPISQQGLRELEDAAKRLGLWDGQDDSPAGDHEPARPSARASTRGSSKSNTK